MTTAPAILRFENVTKRYQLGTASRSLRDAFANIPRFWGVKNGRPEKSGWFDAVKNLSFEVQRGEALGIIGHNGAGKTTTLRLLSGITRPTSGNIRVKGRVSALIELGAGFHPDLTGRENVYLNGSILGIKRKEIDRLFDQIVAFAEIEPFIDTPVKRYSSGMYVRLGFSVAAHIRPDILLVDEVLSVGDMAFQAKCLNRIGELVRGGATVVLVSHNLVQVRRYCGRTILLEQGARLVDGDTETAIQTFHESLARRAAGVQPEPEEAGRGASLTRRVRIQAVRLKNEQGEPVMEVQSNQPCRVEIEFQAQERVKDPVFEVVLLSQSAGGLIARLDTRLGGFEAGEVGPGGGVAQVRLKGIPTKTDRIGLSVSIFSSDYREYYDWNESAASFAVNSENIGEGFLDLEADWRIHPQDIIPAEVR